MDSRASASRYILTTLAIILVVTTFVLIGLNALHIQGLGSVLSPSAAQLDAKYREGYLAAQIKDKMLCPQLEQELKAFSAIILSKNSNSLTVQSDQFNSDPSLNLGDTRDIQIVGSTSIVKITQKSQTAIQQELEASKPGSLPPSPYATRAIAATELKVGDVVSINVTEDVKTHKQLMAVQISQN